MLITSLLPLLARYSLGFDLISGPDDTVTLTIIPRKAEGSKQTPDTREIRPISITASAAEIDAELAKGTDGALGQLIASRKGIADQLADQHAAAEADKAAIAEAAARKAAAAKSASAKSSTASAPAKTPTLTTPPAEATADEPATLW